MAGKDPGPPPASAAEEAYAFPLSFPQQRLWFLQRLDPASTGYNMAAAFRLRGALDAKALAGAVDALVERHEVLRTVYRMVRGEPAQVVLPHRSLGLRAEDLASQAPAAQDKALHDALRAAFTQPFDLERGPVFRARLLGMGPQDHALIVSVHHIAFDGWSTAILVQDLFAAYRALAAGKAPELEELPIQYADYAVWQRDLEAEGGLEAQVAYWRKQLAGVPHLELPTDRPRPREKSYAGATLEFPIPGPLVEALQRVAREQRATPFMLFLAGFQALLARYTGQDDIVVGTPVAGRTSEETERLIGFFVNTLVLRANLSGEPSFRELVKRVQGAALDAFANQEVPFERLVEELHPDRDPSRTPLFQVMFALQSRPNQELRLAEGLDLEPLAPENTAAKFDLVLNLREGAPGGGLLGTFEYSTDLFDRSTIARMARHLTNLLEAAAREPDAPFTALPLLDAAERAQLLDGWNQTRHPVPDDRCMDELVEAHARAAPHLVAVEGQGQALIYGELLARADALAERLRGWGVGPDVPVAVLLERSPDMVLALLAALRAGGCYVPLDPSYPEERLRFMVKDSRAPVVLTQASLRALVEGEAAVLAVVDGSAPMPAPMQAASPPLDRGAASRSKRLAYIIYTSGSTGQPKGVEIEHRTLRSLVAWHLRAYALKPGDRVTQLAGPAFDATAWEVWTGLGAGATIVVADDDTRSDPARLRDWMVRERIAASFVPTPVAEPLVALEWPSKGVLRALLTGGDRLPRGLPGPRPFRFINHYGPTECTVVATAGEVALASVDPRAPPIGRPIDNLRTYVLDRRGQPVPIGVPGELCLGGATLARGYRNRPELTAEKFVPDPFAGPEGGSGARMYRTGDLVRWAADGQLEFLGRLDDQVKIRGFRIELGEIEAALLKHPRVGQASVAVQDDRGGRKHLVAYVVPRDGQGSGAIPGGDGASMTSDLRAFAAATLPGYMVPSQVVALEALPLTPNGKVDRRALPRVTEAQLQGERRHVEPATPAERALAAVWAEVLGLERVGAEDNFFELGGDSLLSVKVVGKAQVQGLPLAPKMLFQHQTVRELAAALEAPAGAAPGDPLLVPLRPAPARVVAPLFLVHPGGGSVGAYRTLVAQMPPEVALLGIQAVGLDDDREPLAGIPAMAARYVEAVRTAQPRGPYRLGGWSLGATIAFEMARQLRAAGEDVALLALLDPGPPLVAAANDAAFAEAVREAEKARVAILAAAEEAARLPPSDPRAAGLRARLDELIRERKREDLLGTEPVLLRRIMRVIGAEMQAWPSYTPVRYEGEAHLFLSEERLPGRPDPAPEVQRWVRTLHVHRVPGSHHTMVFDPVHAKVLAARLAAALGEGGKGP